MDPQWVLSRLRRSPRDTWEKKGANRVGIWNEDMPAERGKVS